MNKKADNITNVYTVRMTEREGGRGVGSHLHLNFELISVTEGSTALTVNGRVETVNAGELAIIPPLCTHSIAVGEGVRLLTGVFAQELILGFLTKDELCSLRSTAVLSPSRALRDYLTDLGFYGVCRRFDGSVTAVRTVRAGLAAIYREYLSVCTEDTQEWGDALRRAVSYISENYRSDITLALVGEAVGFTPWYISHCLEALGDMNFCTLVNSLRIEYAKGLLLTTDMKNADVARESGFTGERSFFRAFSRLVGMTPGEYREKRRAISSECDGTEGAV